MTLSSALVLLGLACVESSGGSSGAPTGPLLAADYHGLNEGSSWIYRDDGGSEVPDEATLLRAQAIAEGEVELRRGQRWADAVTEGQLSWELVGGGVRLLSWSLPSGERGAGADLPVLPVEVEDVAVVEGSGGWSCDITVAAAGVETYYGAFSDALIATCAGGEGLAGEYVFGRGVGLIWLETSEGYTLELVAPW